MIQPRSPGRSPVRMVNENSLSRQLRTPRSFGNLSQSAVANRQSSIVIVQSGRYHVAMSSRIVEPNLSSRRSLPSPESLVPSPERIMQVGLGYWASKTILTAVELGLFTLLAERPRTAEEVRQALHLHPRAIHDFLDALVALGFLQREG